MNTPSDISLRELRQFLEDVFSPSQLEQFLCENGLQSVVSNVKQEEGLSRYCFDVVRQLVRVGRLNADFFSRLADARNGHAERIKALERLLLEGDKPADRPRLLNQAQIEELIEAAPGVGLLNYDQQMELLESAEIQLPESAGRPRRSSELLRNSLEFMNANLDSNHSPLARWLKLVIPLAESRGHAGPYRRALEVISGAEYRSTEELDSYIPNTDHRRRTQEFLTTDFLSQGLKAAASICRVRIYAYIDGKPEKFQDGKPVFVLGTAWLISPSLVMTAWHNLLARTGGTPSPEMSDIRMQVSNAEFEFDFEHGYQSGVVFKNARLLLWNPESDLALLRLDRETNRMGLTLKLNDSHSPNRVSIIHHASGMRKLLSLRGRGYAPEEITSRTTVPEHLHLDKWLIYEVQSSPGSSGAPIFDDGWNVIGQHVGYLTIPPSREIPGRLGIGAKLDAVRGFLTDREVDKKDHQEDVELANAALDEIAKLNNISLRTIFGTGMLLQKER